MYLSAKTVKTIKTHVPAGKNNDKHLKPMRLSAKKHQKPSINWQNHLKPARIAAKT